MKRVKKIVVLGSTGSIGVNTLAVIRNLGPRFQVIGLSANKNIDRLSNQILHHRPQSVAVGDAESKERLMKKIKMKRMAVPRVYHSKEGLLRLASDPQADMVIVAIAGGEALYPLVAAIKAGKAVGLANKESLVMAGDYVMNLVRRTKAPLIPIDSEHSAIFQCLNGQNQKAVSRLILTASGGPFYRYTADFRKIKVRDALRHPTWKMGKKITVDSATLMNKGLEAIEAHHLFGIPMSRISIVIHPESIVHSFVEFCDGSLLAQMSVPDMRLPIQYALTYPERCPSLVETLRLTGIRRLNFIAPDLTRFSCLKLALSAGRQGGTAPCVLNAADEVAVDSFLSGKLAFSDIARVIHYVLKRHIINKTPTFFDIIKADRWARRCASAAIKEIGEKL